MSAKERISSRRESPGLNGLPLKFYLSFWSLLAPDLLSVFNFCFRDVHFPVFFTVRRYYFVV